MFRAVSAVSKPADSLLGVGPQFPTNLIHRIMQLSYPGMPVGTKNIRTGSKSGVM